MADIQTYLHGLEARLAPALDAQSLQERLTEAENHLRDRAQEFEEVGLPPAEAEARAVAAFGEPEEYVADLPPRAAAPVPVAKPEPRRDVALQLAWSLLAVGLVATYAADWTFFGFAGLAASVVLALGAAFGAVTPFRRLLALGVVGAAALFGIFCATYEPFGPNPVHRDRIAALNRLKQEVVSVGVDTHSVDDRLRVFERYQQAFEARSVLPHGLNSGSVLAPSSDPYVTELQPYYGVDGQRMARAMWEQNGELVHQALRQEAEREHEDPTVIGPRYVVFATFAALSGVLLLAALAGLQALGLVLRSGVLWASAYLRRAAAPRNETGRSWERP